MLLSENILDSLSTSMPKIRSFYRNARLATIKYFIATNSNSNADYLIVFCLCEFHIIGALPMKIMNPECGLIVTVLAIWLASRKGSVSQIDRAPLVRYTGWPPQAQSIIQTSQGSQNSCTQTRVRSDQTKSLIYCDFSNRQRCGRIQLCVDTKARSQTASSTRLEKRYQYALAPLATVKSSCRIDAEIHQHHLVAPTHPYLGDIPLTMGPYWRSF